MLETLTTPPPAQPAAEDDIVARLRAGDEAAFEWVMRQHNERLFRIARSILRDPTEAEDVVQETYVRAFTRLDTYQATGPFGAWLARIAANEAYDRARRLKVQRAHGLAPRPSLEDSEQTVMSVQSPDPDPERQAASLELRGLLERAIDRLPAAFRSVFVLRAVEQMSIAETAACLNIPEATVKTRFHRARRLLRADLLDEASLAWPTVYGFGGQRCDRIVDGVMARIRAGTGAT